VGSKTAYTFDDGSLFEFGLAWHEYPHENNRNNPTGTPNFWDWHDLNATVRYARTDSWWGHESRSNVSFTSTEHFVGKVDTIDGTNRSHLLSKKSYKNSFDRTFSVGNDLELTDGLWLTSGLSAFNFRRKISIDYSTRTDTRDKIDYEQTGWVPRLGLRYALTPGVQVFGNVTRSIDPPLDWRYANSSADRITPLFEQKSNTVEVGIKGHAGVFDGSLVLYRSYVHDELLTVVDEEASALQGSTVTRTFNSDTPTRHQGVELGLDARLWENAGNQIVLRQAYTWNDFHYRNEPRLGNNRLPGIPEHIYQAKLEYQHGGGFWAGINIQSASETAVDYANTLYAPGYTIFGLGAGYESPKKDWKAYVDLKNITDEKYVVTANATYDAQGNKNIRNFFPGDGLGVFAGVELRF
jgi:iron complex outermembrane receptor protein